MRQFFSFVLIALLGSQLHAIEILVDYRFDTNNFFDQQIKKDALEAAAARFSRVITSSLNAAEPSDWRLGFTHPGTGDAYQLSTAANAAADPLEPFAGAADIYGFEGLAQDTWLLFAGGQDLVSAGIGGTGTGPNFTSTFDDLDGPMHRGVISNTPDNSANDLPAWGGSISFNENLDWHFGLDAPFENSDIDFYTIALHEIGHALGISTTWNQWSQHVNNDAFAGQNAVNAYNTENSTALTELLLQPGGQHWREATYQSFVFQPGEPSTTGTVGLGLQDLLLEPRTDFTSLVRRMELTNVDAASLADVGWSILATAPSLDLTGDGVIDGMDVNNACADGASLEPYFAELNSLAGDLDLDGSVQFSDFLRLSANFGQAGSYTDGDVTCDGLVSFPDFLLVSTSFGQTAVASLASENFASASAASQALASVPEPSSGRLVISCLTCLALLFRRRL